MSQSGILGIGAFPPGGITWVEVTVGGPTGMLVNHGYVANTTAPTLCQLTLPAAAAFGSIIRICGKGTGLFQVQQNAGQQIHYGNLSTTAGVAGTLTSTQRRDTVDLLCTTANTEFTVLNSIGILNVA